MFRQNIMWSFEKLNPGTTTYHRSAAVEVTGPIQIDLLTQAVKAVMRRHDILRMRLIEQESGAEFELIPDEQLPKSPSWPLEIMDATLASDASLENLYETLQKIGKKDFIERLFDFDAEPMWRTALIRLSENKHQFALLFHHMIVDETSIGIILKDISTYYNALLTHTEPALTPIPALSTVKTCLSEEAKKERLTYWKENLSALNTIKLQPDKLTNASLKFSGERIPFKLDQPLVNQLTASMPGFSFNSILLACLYTLLYRYSGETDICMGITSANRRHDGFVPREVMENLVNAYFNSIPIRVRIEETDTELIFSDILRRVHTAVGTGLKKQLPHEEVFRHALSANTRSSLVTASPYNCMLVTNPVKPTLNLLNTHASRLIELDLGHCKFDSFGINCDELNDGSYECIIEYNKDKFDRDTIIRLIGHFNCILRQVADNPHIVLDNISILSNDEKVLLDQYNDTQKAAEYTGNVPDFFHQAASAAPAGQRFAVYHRDDGEKEALTYADLETKTNQIANYINQCVKEPGLVGICLSRSIHLLEGTVAAFKSGHTILVAPTLLKNLDSLLGAALPACMLVDNTTKDFFAGKTLRLINLDDPVTLAAIANCSGSYISPAISSRDTVYLTQTSGSTGTPKLVIMSHAALENLLNSLAFDQQHQPHTKIICTSPATFDGFFYDILLAFVTCGELHVPFDKGRLNPDLLNEIIINEKIDFAAMIAEILAQLDTNTPLHRVISMGAIAREATLNLWASSGKHVENDLGLAETCIQLSVHRYLPGDDYAVIGSPIRNMQMLVLDAHGNLCPPGVVGEVFVGGIGLADGYLNNPELTTEKFKHAKLDKSTYQYTFVREQGSDTVRLYATGDYGCYKKTNDNKLHIKLIGRLDDQLKIHGIRVEMNEVRKTILKHPMVKDVIIVSYDNRTALAAYILPVSNDILLDDMRTEIRRYLSKTNTPAVARPRSITTLSKIPLSPNGKVNINALPKPIEYTPLQVQPSATELQSLLVPLWIKALETPAGEIDWNAFFSDQGGDSLAFSKLLTYIYHDKNIQSLLHLPPRLPVIKFIEWLSKDMTITGLGAALEKFAASVNQYARNPYIFLAPPPPSPESVRAEETRFVI